jgi:hypothetical protein
VQICLQVLQSRQHLQCHFAQKAGIPLNLGQWADLPTPYPLDPTHSHRSHANPSVLGQSGHWIMVPTVVTRPGDHLVTMVALTVLPILHANVTHHQVVVDVLFLAAGLLSGCPMQPTLETGLHEKLGTMTNETCVHHLEMREHRLYVLLRGTPEILEIQEINVTDLTPVVILFRQRWSLAEYHPAQRLLMNTGVMYPYLIHVTFQIAATRVHHDHHQLRRPHRRTDPQLTQRAPL